MNNRLINSAYASVPGAILTAILGLVWLIWPSFSTTLICYLLSAGLLIFGGYLIVSYMNHTPQEMPRKHGLSIGMILIAIALLTLIRPDVVISLLPTLLGLLLVLGAARETQIAVDLRRMGAKRWYSPLIAGGVQAVLGIIILCDPFATAMVTMRFIGASLLIESLSQIIFDIVFKRSKKTPRSDAA